MKIAYICSLLKIFERHDEWNVLDMKMMMFAENVNKPFTHIAIDAALYRVVYRRDMALNFEKNVKEPG